MASLPYVYCHLRKGATVLHNLLYNRGIERCSRLFWHLFSASYVKGERQRTLITGADLGVSVGRGEGHSELSFWGSGACSPRKF